MGLPRLAEAQQEASLQGEAVADEFRQQRDAAREELQQAQAEVATLKQQVSEQQQRIQEVLPDE